MNRKAMLATSVLLGLVLVSLVLAGTGAQALWNETSDYSEAVDLHYSTGQAKRLEQAGIPPASSVLPGLSPSTKLGTGEAEGTASIGAVEDSAVPTYTLTYQGHLQDADGDLVEDGPYEMSFSIWDDEAGGTRLWGPEAHEVDISDGFFAVTLGLTEPITGQLTPEVYLEMGVEGETLTPRQRLGSVVFALQSGFALWSGNAEMLEGEDGDFYRRWDNLSGVPAGFADGTDDDTVYTAGVGLTLTGDEFSVDFADVAAAGHTHDDRYYGKTELESPGDAEVHWDNLAAVPAGFADGMDDDTIYTDADTLAAVDAAGYLTEADVPAYTAGSGLTLIDEEFNVDFTAVAAAGHDHDDRYYSQTALQTAGDAEVHWQNLTVVPSDIADGDDVLPYEAGDGLDVFGTELSVDASDLAGEGLDHFKNDLAVDFSGTGTATTVARSDHHHDDRYHTEDELRTSGSGAEVHWDNLSGAPAGFADGTDDDTVYTAGAGLTLTETEFSVNLSALVLPPVGSIIAWHESMTDTPPLPDGWVECSGQLITDPESPYDGLRVPNLNSDVQDGSTDSGMFLRGGSTSGVKQADATAPNGLGATTTAVQASEKSYTGTTDAPDTFAGATGAVSLFSSDDETRPANMTVVWIVKIRGQIP